MAEFAVGDVGAAYTWTATKGGLTVGSLVGLVVNSCRVKANGVWIRDTTSGFTGAAASALTFAVPDSSFFTHPGTWTFDVRYTLGGVTQSLDTITFQVALGGVSAPGAVAGATTATAINAQIIALSATATRSRPARIFFPGGTYVLTEDVVGASNVWIECDPDAVFDCTAITGVAPFDDPTVCAVTVAGTTSTAKINTTLSGAHYPGDRTITVVDDGTIGDGEWIYIESSAASLLYKEMLRVSGAPAANVITTRTGLRLVHPGTATVTQVTPVENFRWTGGMFTASGGTCASAFLFRGALDCRVDGVRFLGFTRAAIMLDRATTTFGSADCYTDGECNSGLYAECAHDIAVERWTTNPQATLYQHASGYSRHHFIASHGVTGFAVTDCVLQHVAGGVRLHSGSSHRVTNCTFKDLDPTRLLTDGVTAGDLDASTDPLGIAICGSYAPVSKADWVDGVVIANILAEDIYCPTSSNAFELHDWRHPVIDCIPLINLGVDPNVRRMTGFRVDDLISASISRLHAKGIENALQVYKTPSNLRISDCQFNGTHPAGSAQYGVTLALTASATAAAVLSNIVVANFSSVWRYTGGYTGDVYSEISDFKGSWNVPRAMQWYNAGASIPAGSPVVEVAGGTFRRVTTAGAQSPNVLVTTEAAAADYVWCSEKSGTRFVRAHGAVDIAVGDRLETDGAGGFVRSVLTDDRAPFIAMEAHTAASYAVIAVRPA